MMVKVLSAANAGLDAIGIDVEVNMASRGLPVLDIVGMPNKAVAESKERVRTAILNSGIEFPQRRIIVNLAPADVPKEGSCYDLPIAIGIIAMIMGFDIPQKSIFFGELSLDGSLRHTRGALLAALHARDKGLCDIFVPAASANEAAVVSKVSVYPVSSIVQLIGHITQSAPIVPAAYHGNEQDASENSEVDMAQIVGQGQAKRAIEISAAGGHNCFMVGSPGAGKTMLARALSGILPRLDDKESLEVSKIYSICGRIAPGGALISSRPFRSPHHTISQAGLAGGGSSPQPGEISLAHRGVLFLDELNEFPRSVLEVLRQPIEEGALTISRSKEQVTFPCRFMLVASANPCPCGYLRHPSRACVCSPADIQRYRRRISGPILDRIDLHVDVPVVNIEELAYVERAGRPRESSAVVRERVFLARNMQRERFIGQKVSINAEMNNRHIARYCRLSPAAKNILVKGAEKFDLSARAYFKVIKIARTIADLDGQKDIGNDHVAEALQYRARIKEVRYAA